jgi:YVTN family beta-propeller protein
MTKLKLGRLIGVIAGAVLAVATPVQAAPMAYVTSSFTDDVSVIDTTTKTLVTTIPVGGSPFGVSAHPAGSHVYVANWGDDTVSVISTATNTVLRTIPVGQGPFGVALHPAGTHVYVANQLSDTVSVIDTATGTVTRTIGVGSRPIGVAVHPGGRLYVVNQWSFTVSVIDTGTNTVVGSVPVGSMPIGVAVSPNGSRIYVTNSSSRTVSVIDTATNTVSATVAVGVSPLGVAVHPSGSHVYVANSGSGTVSVIDAATNAVVAAPFAGFGLFGIGVTPSGSHVYAASEDDNAVFEIATSTNAVTDRITVRSGPAAFGTFLAAPAVCETAELEAALATCQADLATATTRIGHLEAVNGTLTTENDRLRNQQGGASSDLIRALVSVLFGDRPDAAVAEAVRDATSARLAAARAAAAQDPRLRQAQRAFDTGRASMTAQDWPGAIRSFRDAYNLARQIQAEASLRSGAMRR